MRSAERLRLITEKEVMVMFKAPWVKISTTPLEEKNNLFQATILSMQNEEAILQIKDSSIEFCASIHSKDGWDVYKRQLQALAEVAQKLVQVAQQQADAQQAQSNSKPNDDVVDAEFEEVKDRCV